MSAHKIMEILGKGVEDGIFSSATLGVQHGGLEPWFFTAEKGTVAYCPDLSGNGPIKPNVHDIASVTKFLLAMLFYRLMTHKNKIAEEIMDSNAEGAFARAQLVRNLHPDRLVIDFMPIGGQHSQFLFVRHLLNFHARFRDFGGPEEIIRGNIAKHYRDLIQAGFASSPGSEYRYANAHSILLGVLLEHVFGEPLEMLFQKHLVCPLGLASTVKDPTGMSHRVVPGADSLPRHLVHDPVGRMAIQEGRLIGSAGLFSSAPDLMKVLSLITNRGYADSRDAEPFIHPSWIDRLHQPENPARKFATGMGYWANLRENLEIYNPTEVEEGLFKSGWTGSMVAAFRNIGACFAITTNFLSIKRNPGELARAQNARNILYLRLGEEVIQAALGR